MKKSKGLENLREVEVVIVDIQCYRTLTFNGRMEEEEPVKKSKKAREDRRQSAGRDH